MPLQVIESTKTAPHVDGTDMFHSGLRSCFQMPRSGPSQPIRTGFHPTKGSAALIPSCKAAPAVPAMPNGRSKLLACSRPCPRSGRGFRPVALPWKRCKENEPRQIESARPNKSGRPTNSDQKMAAPVTSPLFHATVAGPLTPSIATLATSLAMSAPVAEPAPNTHEQKPKGPVL